jgi:nucleoside-diphosphate-sugar epimerase
MKILVIGNGFIGSPIIQKLQSEGHELLNFSRSLKVEIQCQQVKGDFFSPEDVREILKWDPEVIIHTAWITTPGIYKIDQSNYKFSESTIHLAKSILQSNVKHLLVLGTCAEYGHRSTSSTAGITEVSPNNLYAEQKVSTFRSIQDLLVGSKIRFTWARVFLPYGPKQDDKRLIPYLIKSLKAGSPIQLADTSSIYDWISVRDISSAISWTISKTLPTEIDIGTSIGFSNLQLLTMLAELLPSNLNLGRLGPHEIGLGDVFITGKDSPLLKSGWLPKDSLQSGLEWVLNT